MKVGSDNSSNSSISNSISNRGSISKSGILAVVLGARATAAGVIVVVTVSYLKVSAKEHW